MRSLLYTQKHELRKLRANHLCPKQNHGKYVPVGNQNFVEERFAILGEEIDIRNSIWQSSRAKEGERTQLSGVPISLLLPRGYSQDSRPDSNRLRANAYKRSVQSLFEHGSSGWTEEDRMEQRGNVKF